MTEKSRQVMGWGKPSEIGIEEFWDARPIFSVNSEFSLADKMKLFFFPKKLLLYNWIEKSLKEKRKANKQTGKFSKLRILDIGCGTGASVIEMKKMWGKKVEVYGVDVIKIQIELAKKRVKEYGVWAKFDFYENDLLPFQNNFFDVVFSSDVLGHVKDVPNWLEELQRVLVLGGRLAMFSESKLGKHAYIRNYLYKRGCNTDPHAEFHISLYSKDELKNLLENSSFEIKKMYTAFWLSFFVHPDEFYEALQKQKRFFFLRNINKVLYWIKKKTQPVSTALAEFYGLVEMLTLGKFLEVQGYIVLAKKTNHNKDT
ncbi:MAG: class I SAM-dependent methyltransferase [Candidatus Magasanikbacteria bacterium]